MTMIRQQVAAQITPLGDDEVELILSTGYVARDGHILVPQGCDLEAYRQNPVWLWSHDPLVPVGRCDWIVVDNDEIKVRMHFAPAGISPKADEIRGLVKAGVINAASVGFEPKEGEPLDPKKPKGGQRWTRWELLEASFVAVPADPAALITARQQKDQDMADWRCGASRDLAVEDSDAWDGSAAEKSIFEHAGGDDFDPAIARRGFLAYDAENPKKRESYKLPIAHMVGGQLKVPKGAIRAAASRLSSADIPAAVKDKARAVIDHYEQKAGMGEDGDRRRRPQRRQSLPLAKAGARAARRPLVIRGMYGVGQLAFLVDCLCDAKLMAEAESAMEGDNSPVPGMLASVLRDLGEALVAMTKEEVAELVENDEPDDQQGVDGGLGTSEAAMVMAAKTPAVKRFRLGYFRARAAAMAQRAGKALSAANAARLADVESHHARAMAHHSDAVDCHGAIGDCHDGIGEAHARCMRACNDMGEALADKDGERCMRAHRAMTRNLDAIADHNQGLGDEHEALGDAQRGIGRCVRAANRCLRAVEGHEPAAAGEDGDSQLIQTSGGTSESTGSDDGRGSSYQQRQARVQALAKPAPIAA